MKNYFTAIILFLFCINSYSQNFTSNVKGVVKDAFTDETLISANITLTVDTLKFHTTSDNEGKFSFEKVNAGRISLQVNYLGYEPYIVNNLRS